MTDTTITTKTAMTTPIQPASQTASPVRTAKTASNSTGLPFNAVLTQEVAQRNGEPPRADGSRTESPGAAKAGHSEQAPEAEDKLHGIEKNTAEDIEAIDGTIAAAPPEILALVAELSQFTEKTAAVDTASVPTVDGTIAAAPPAILPLIAEMSQFTRTTAAINTASALTAAETGAKSGKQVALNVEKADVSDNAAAMTHSRTPDVFVPNDGANAKGQGIAAAFLRTAPYTAEAAAAGSQVLKSMSATSPSSLDNVVPMQQASASFNVLTAATNSDKLLPPVGTPAWDQALGNKVVWMAGTAVQTASLTLNPPDLGPLQVVLNVSNNQATAAFTAAQPEVRQALEAAMPKLRELMQEAGIQLSEATVDAGTSSRQEMADHGTQSGSRKSTGHDMPSPNEQAGLVARQQPVMRSQGLVDTFA